MTIAIFDSGAGGLTVLNTFLKLNCTADYIYFADYQHLPYGDKKPAIVAKYVLDSVNFLAKKKIDALVIACNTATSLAIQELRNQTTFNFPIFGMEPAVKLAVDQLHSKNKQKKAEILITATHITVHSQQLADLKKRFADQANFSTLVLGDLVKFVENKCFDQKIIDAYLKNKIEQKKHYDAIVLGCTHFSFFRKSFESLFPQSLICDGNLGTVHHVINKLKLESLKKETKQKTTTKITFYFSQKKNILLRLKYQDLLKKLD